MSLSHYYGLWTITDFQIIWNAGKYKQNSVLEKQGEKLLRSSNFGFKGLESDMQALSGD